SWRARNGALRPACQEDNDDATLLAGAVRGRAGVRPVGRDSIFRTRPGPFDQPLLLLPLLLLPPQLLADQQPAVAGEAGGAVHAAAGLHGLPALPRAALALLALGAPAVLPRVPLLARPDLSRLPAPAQPGRGGVAARAVAPPAAGPT